jgi:peptidoglycan hydrolase-like protein with peptidoglycan-binding domain
MRAANRPRHGPRLDSHRTRLIVASSSLAAATMLVGGTAIIAKSSPWVASTTQAAAPTTVAPTTAAPATVTAAPTSVAPTTTLAPTTVAPPTTIAPTTTAPSPAIVPIAAPEYPFVAVGSSSGGETARIQQRLLDLGFWNSGADGDYGLTTSQAVMAFQKYIGLEASGSVNQATADALTGLTFRAHGLADAGTLVEIDKTHQLLFIVQSGRTVWVYNTSTGNGEPYEEEDRNTPGEVQAGVSITRSGLHEVYRERAVGWWEGDLGRIYRPKYFSGGQAVHGSNNVPNYPASHGCVRVSIPAMDFIWDQNLMPIHTPVWVHGQDPG